MVFKCCVPNCPFKNETNRMHSFPRDPEVFLIWLNAIHREDLYAVDQDKVVRNYRVCDAHFSDDSRFWGQRNRTDLRRDAVPTLCLGNTDENSQEKILTNTSVEIEQATTANLKRKIPHLLSHIKKGADTFQCSNCNKRYGTKSGLFYHQKINACTSERKEKRLKTEGNKLRCSLQGCFKTFSKPESLIYHEKYHNDNEPAKLKKDSKIAKECAVKGCPQILESGLDLRNHLIYDHSINIQLEKLSFRSQWDFQKWKLGMESKTVCKYKLQLMKNPQKSSNGYTKHYNCCEIRNEDRLSKRACPSSMEVEEENHNITVLFYKTHVGHRQKDAVILSKSFMYDVGSLLRLGHSVNGILRKIQQNVITCPNSQNLHLITKEHIHLIAKDCNVPLPLTEPPPLVLRSGLATSLSTDANIRDVVQNIQVLSDIKINNDQILLKSNSNQPTENDKINVENITLDPSIFTNQVEDNVLSDADTAIDLTNILSDEETNVMAKIKELTELVNEGISDEKCQDLVQCLDLALSVVKNEMQIILD